MYHVVTTTNAAGWEQTGRRMVESFNRHWKSGTLCVYAEGFDPDLPVEVRRLPEWQSDFKRQYRNVAGYNGHRPGKYDFRFDLVKFSHKAAALTDFGKSVSDGVMIWLDIDTFTHADVDDAWLDSLMPESAYIGWLERMNGPPETGFVLFRATHGYHHRFMESLENLYTGGVVTKMLEYHDAYLIWFLAKSKAAKGKIPYPSSLSGDAHSWHHPFVAGPLGARIDHMKGPRKEDGRSNVRRPDLRRPRSEPYWQNA